MRSIFYQLLSRASLLIVFVILTMTSISASTPLPASPNAPLRISTWYWLNSIEKEHWDEDFKNVSKAGFTDIILCWGLDSAAVLSQQENTRLALELCKKNNIRAYLFIWHPTHNSLPRKAEFQQVDSKGNLLFTFNIFNRKWRATEWRDYLQSVAKAYKDQAAFAGYLFDDTFALGPINSFGGDTSEKRGDFVSYSAYDREQFTSWLQKKYSDIGALNKVWQTEYKEWANVEMPRTIKADNEAQWKDWTLARRDWIREWAEDTVQSIREIDSNKTHEIYVEDTVYALGSISNDSKESVRPITVKDNFGLDFGYCLQPFDAVCGYNFFNWAATNSLDIAKEQTVETLKVTRALMGNDKKIIYTFWASDIDFDNTAPIKFPTAEQIITITELALKLGINHIDYYGFRIGDWRVNEADWLKLRPGSNRNYPLTKPMKSRFLVDRDNILKDLAQQHNRLFDQLNPKAEPKVEIEGAPKKE